MIFENLYLSNKSIPVLSVASRSPKSDITILSSCARKPDRDMQLNVVSFILPSGKSINSGFTTHNSVCPSIKTDDQRKKAATMKLRLR